MGNLNVISTSESLKTEELQKATDAIKKEADAMQQGVEKNKNLATRVSSLSSRFDGKSVKAKTSTEKRNQKDEEQNSGVMEVNFNYSNTKYQTIEVSMQKKFEGQEYPNQEKKDVYLLSITNTATGNAAEIITLTVEKALISSDGGYNADDLINDSNYEYKFSTGKLITDQGNILSNNETYASLEDIEKVVSRFEENMKRHDDLLAKKVD